jgi:hypothetical protein
VATELWIEVSVEAGGDYTGYLACIAMDTDVATELWLEDGYLRVLTVSSVCLVSLTPLTIGLYI